MTVIFSFQVKGDNWKALGGEGQYGFVCVPSNAIPTLSDAEIAHYVRESVQYAELARAAEYAGNYRSINDRQLDYEIKCLGEDATKYLELFEQFAGEYQEIALVATRFRAAIERVNKRVQARKQVKVSRREFGKDYPRLFYTIGKRDGFKCKSCGSVDDLTLDHITPLIAGGGNNESNLQILCRPCNSRKGARNG